MSAICAYCKKPHGRLVGEINRAAKYGLRLFCNRKCAGMGRRKPKKPKAQRVAEKRVYDMAYRDTNKTRIKARKHAYFERTYDPRKAAVVRKARMHLHVAYCRQPKYKAWKHDYDKIYLAKRWFGLYWESALLVHQLEAEIDSRMSKQDIRIINGTYNKVQFRRRDYEKQNQVAIVRN